MIHTDYNPNPASVLSWKNRLSEDKKVNEDDMDVYARVPLDNPG
jgi:hypothetical protein